MRDGCYRNRERYCYPLAGAIVEPEQTLDCEFGVWGLGCSRTKSAADPKPQTPNPDYTLSMNVLAVQLDIAWHDKPANYSKLRAILGGVAVAAGSLVVLPEMFATGFSMAAGQIAEVPGGETEQFLLALANEFDVCIIAGITSRGPDGRGRNEAFIAFPNSRPPLRYQKIHPFIPGGEAEHYAAGSEILVFDWQGFRVAPFICYDLRFPELFRAAMLRGAQVLAVIASLLAVREEHWVTLLRARAIENQCYVIGVNRCGKDPNFAYTGRSQVLGPRGAPIAEAGTRECAIAAQLNLPALIEYRKQLPFLQDAVGPFAPCAYSHSALPLERPALPPEQHQKERPSQQGGEHADGQLRVGEPLAGEQPRDGIRGAQQGRAQGRGAGQQSALVGADDQPRDVRTDQADEPNR